MGKKPSDQDDENNEWEEPVDDEDVFGYEMDNSEENESDEDDVDEVDYDVNDDIVDLQSIGVDVVNHTLRIRLDIDPDETAAADDEFTLLGVGNDESYEQTLTVKDDYLPFNDILDLVFTGLREDLIYSLEINPGKEGNPYYIFQNVPFKDLNIS